MRTAVIGIGSNSVRMLLAEIEQTHGRRLRRDRAATRLFAGLDAEGRLSQAAMTATVDVVAQMALSARISGAQDVQLFATSATRDAVNADDFAALIREKAGLELRVCAGQEEAELSYLGASDGGDCGVIDIGGGSTELVLGRGGKPELGLSCQMGAVRLHRLLAIDSPDDLPSVIAAARGVLAEALERTPDWHGAQTWRGTGGTFTALAALIRGTAWTDRAGVHNTPLPRESVEAQAKLLSGLTVAERKKLPNLQPGRADIVVHGICILLACMDLLEIGEITVSEYGNLEGDLIRRYGLTSLV